MYLSESTAVGNKQARKNTLVEREININLSTVEEAVKEKQNSEFPMQGDYKANLLYTKSGKIKLNDKIFGLVVHQLPNKNKLYKVVSEIGVVNGKETTFKMLRKFTPSKNNYDAVQKLNWQPVYKEEYEAARAK